MLLKKTSKPWLKCTMRSCASDICFYAGDRIVIKQRYMHISVKVFKTRVQSPDVTPGSFVFRGYSVDLPRGYSRKSFKGKE